MEDFIVGFFEKYSRYIVLFHILSSTLLVGGFFVMSFLIRPIINKIKIPSVKYGSGIEFVKKFLICTVVCLFIILITGVLMSVGLRFSSGNPATNVIIHTLEALWIFISANSFYMFMKYRESKKYFAKNEHIEIHENLELIFRYVIPLNLIIGVISIYFGILLRGF